MVAPIESRLPATSTTTTIPARAVVDSGACGRPCEDVECLAITQQVTVLTGPSLLRTVRAVADEGIFQLARQALIKQDALG